MEKFKYKKGDKVFWNDPEGLTSQEYTVVEAPSSDEDIEDGIYFLSNESGECQALECELED